jgi:FtsP/CotA-like multicopper oxidase with cupredoxin domain
MNVDAHAALVVLLLVVVIAPTQTAAAAAAHQSFHITVGQPINTLPGSDILNPKHSNTNVSITLLPLRINWPPYIQFTAPAYRDDSTGLALPFGPTIRVKRGGEYHIRLTNGLPAEGAANSMQLTELARNARKQNSTTNWWQHSMMTNLHTHGECTVAGLFGAAVWWLK